MPDIIETTNVRDERLDLLEQVMMRYPPPEGLEIVHRFTPGLYIREMRAPAGSIITSKIHKTEHPFVVSQGRIVLFTELGPIQIVAPYTGITPPGTRRVAYVLEPTIWTTFHPTAYLGLTDEQDLGQIEAAIIEPHQAHLEGLTQPPPQGVLP